MEKNQIWVIIIVALVVAVITSIVTVSLSGKVINVSPAATPSPGYTQQVYNTTEINQTIYNLTIQINALAQNISNLTRTGNLYVVSSPSSVYVFLDGRSRGTTPILITNLIPKIYSVKVSKAGSKDYYSNVTIIPARTSYLNVTLLNVTLSQNSSGNFTL